MDNLIFIWVAVETSGVIGHRPLAFHSKKDQEHLFSFLKDVDVK